MQDVFTSLYSDLCKCRQENEALQRQCKELEERNKSYDEIVSLLNGIKDDNITIAQNAQKQIEKTQNDQKTEFETFKQTQNDSFKELKDCLENKFALLNRAVSSLEEERKNVKKAQDDANELRGSLEKKGEELKSREEELENSPDLNDLQNELKVLKEANGELKEEVSDNETKIAELQGKIQQKDEEIEEKNGEITELKESNRTLMEELKKKEKNSSPCEQNEAGDVNNGN